MGLGIDWSALLAPTIVKIVEKLVEMIFAWLKNVETKDAITTVAVLCDKLTVLEDTDDAGKITAVKDLAVWVRSVVA